MFTLTSYVRVLTYGRSVFTVPLTLFYSAWRCTTLIFVHTRGCRCQVLVTGLSTALVPSFCRCAHAVCARACACVCRARACARMCACVRVRARVRVRRSHHALSIFTPTNPHRTACCPSTARQGTTGVTITNCTFDRLQGNGVMVSGFNRNATVSHSDFSFLGGNAVVAWGYVTNAADLLFDSVPSSSALLMFILMAKFDYADHTTSCFPHCTSNHRFETQTRLTVLEDAKYLLFGSALISSTQCRSSSFVRQRSLTTSLVCLLIHVRELSGTEASASCSGLGGCIRLVQTFSYSHF